jgi:hypothetical protein
MLVYLSVTIIRSCFIFKLSMTNSYKIEDLFSIPKAARVLVINDLMVWLYREVMVADCSPNGTNRLELHGNRKPGGRRR